MLSRLTSPPLWLALLGALLLLAACGGGDSSSKTPGASGDASGSPTATANPLIPPLEGPNRPTYLGDTTNFREDPAFHMPSPNDVPAPTAGTDPITNPPSEPDCPSEWTKLQRPTEGFDICYPSGWQVASNGYVNAPNEVRWYSVGIFKFPGDPPEHQLAHVSVYVIPNGARPFPYTKDCPAPYSVRLDGQPSVVCPSFPATSPESRIVSYNVYRLNLDYFINIATYLKYDADSGDYTDETDQAALDEAVKIVDSLTFTDIPSPITGASPSPAVTPTS